MAWISYQYENGWLLTAANGGLSYNAAYTKMCWARCIAADTTGATYVLSIQDSAGAGFANDIAGFNVNAKIFALYVRVSDGNEAGYGNSNLTPWVLGRWYHMTMRRNSPTSIDLLINGEYHIQGTLDVGTARDSSSENAFGFWRWGGGWSARTVEACAYKGWQRALTDSEIKQEMYSYLPRTMNGLRYYFPFVNGPQGHIVGYPNSNLTKYEQFQARNSCFNSSEPYELARTTKSKLTPSFKKSWIPLIPRVIKTINVTGDGNVYANVNMTYKDWSGNVKGTTVTLSPATSYVKPNSFVDATVTIRDSSNQPITNANVFVMGMNARILANVAAEYGALTNLSAPVALGNVSPSGYRAWRFNETSATGSHMIELWGLLPLAQRNVNDVRYVRMEFRSSRGAVRLDHTGEGYCEIGISPGNPVPTKYTYNSLTFGGEYICIPKGNDWYDLLVYTPKCLSLSGDVYIAQLQSPTNHSSSFAGDTQQYIDVGRLEVGSGNVVPFIGTASYPSPDSQYGVTLTSINELSPSGKAVSRITEQTGTTPHENEYTNDIAPYKGNTWLLKTAEVRDTNGRGFISAGFSDGSSVAGVILNTTTGALTTYSTGGIWGEVFAGAKKLTGNWWEVWTAWRWDVDANIYSTIGIQDDTNFGGHAGDTSKYIDIGNVWLLQGGNTDSNGKLDLRAVALFDNNGGTANLFVMQRPESIENAAVGNVIVSPYGGQSAIGVSSFPWTPRVRITSL